MSLLTEGGKSISLVACELLPPGYLVSQVKKPSCILLETKSGFRFEMGSDFGIPAQCKLLHI